MGDEECWHWLMRGMRGEGLRLGGGMELGDEKDAGGIEVVDSEFNSGW